MTNAQFLRKFDQHPTILKLLQRDCGAWFEILIGPWFGLQVFIGVETILSLTEGRFLAGFILFLIGGFLFASMGRLLISACNENEQDQNQTLEE